MKIVKVYKKTCEHCGEEFNFREDHILHLPDTTDAFKDRDIYINSIICPICWQRNILETKGYDGVVNTRKYEYDEEATRILNQK